MNWKAKLLSAFLALGLVSRWLAGKANEGLSGWDEVFPIVEQVTVTLVFCTGLYLIVRALLALLRRLLPGERHAPTSCDEPGQSC